MKILVIEDEAKTARFLQKGLGEPVLWWMSRQMDWMDCTWRRNSISISSFST